jgi:hypothetical protein
LKLAPAGDVFHSPAFVHSRSVGNYVARCGRFLGISTCDRQAVRETLMVMNVTDVEGLRERIGELVRERQELRTTGASRRSLEWNRVQLARRQSELGRALIEQHIVAPI